MQGKDFLIGTLRPSSYLKTDSKEILLTRITMQAAQSPESAALEIAPEDVGKMALVRGDLSGDVLYSAHIVETFSPVTAILVKTLINKSKPLVLKRRFKKQRSRGFTEGHTRSYQMT
jgi:hypothetical protein